MKRAQVVIEAPAEKLERWRELRARVASLPSPYIRDPVGWVEKRLGEHLWSKQRDIAEAVRDHRHTAVHSAFETGKGLALDTPVPTPNGWTTIGAISAGTLVFNEDGEPVRVTWVSPTRNLPCYEVTFDDETSVICDRDHLWQTIPFQFRKARHDSDDWRDAWDVSSTIRVEELADDVLTSAGKRRHRIPVAHPLQLPPLELPFDPYLLGVWLGDGTTVRSDITTADDEIAEAFRAAGFDLGWRGRLTFKFARTRERTANALLDQIGVLGNKHIPDQYLRASAPQRLALLQGLMDTDGSIPLRARSAGCSIDLCDEKLSYGVAELIRTFGWRVNVRPRTVTFAGRAIPRWRMEFRPDRQVFRLPRKAEILAPMLDRNTAQASRRTARMIASVEPVSSVPTRCLAVDSPRSLFLVGESMVPTHNSYTAARLVCWWLDSHPAYSAFVVTTATTGAQVRAILWREIGRAHKKGRLPGRTNQTEWHIGDELVGFGRKPADYDPDAFQGIHAEFVLVVIDEASGVPKAIFDAAEGLIANENSRILAIGNPADPMSHFAKACAVGSGWHTIHIDAFDTPNFTGEEVPDHIRPLLISPLFAEERAKEWGENSPLYVAKVRGRFPEDAEDGVVRGSKAMHCRRAEQEPGDGMPVELGVDVGAGGDFTSIYERRGRKAGRVWRDHSKDSEVVVGKIIAAIRESGATRVKVDTIGIGWGVVGHLRSMEGEHHAQIVPVNVGEASSRKDRFPLLRDQIWWEVGRELSEQDAWDLSAVDDDTMAQLLAPKYGLDAHGRVKIEPKDETRKRIGRSPDDADALLLAFYVGHQPGTAVSSAQREI